MNADDLFRQLEPPPGGAERFALRLDEAAIPRAGARWRPFAWAGAAAAVIVAAVMVVLPREPSAPDVQVADSTPAPVIYDSPAFDRLLGRPLPTEQLTAVVDQQAAQVTELESQNAKVRIYQLN